MRKILLYIAAILQILAVLPVYAIDCSPLEPKGGANVNIETKGSVDSKIKGAFAKLVGVEVGLDGAYRAVRSDTLRAYPNADQIYIWERFIYLNCETLDESDLTAIEKLDRLERLQARMLIGPPNDTAALRKELKAKYREVLNDIRISLYRKDEFMFPAMKTFLSQPTEQNWNHVVYHASENLRHILNGIDKSFVYDAGIQNQVASIDSIARRGLDQAQKPYIRTFRQTRDQWNKRAVVLRHIQTTKNMPTAEEAQAWLLKLKGYYEELQAQIQAFVATN